MTPLFHPSEENQELLQSAVEPAHSKLRHFQRGAHGRVSTYPPDFRIEIVVNEGDAPKDGHPELNRDRQFGGWYAVRCLQSEITKNLARCLIHQAKQNSEPNVVDQTPADERRRTEYSSGFALSAARMAALQVLLVMKPNQPVILQVVIDR